MNKVIAIINCDMDESVETNGSCLLYNLIPNSIVINLCNGEEVRNVRNYEAFIITGSHASHNDNFPWIQKLKFLITQIHHHSIPCLGICFGMQVIAQMFNGTVELGKINESGFNKFMFDPVAGRELTNDLPNGFRAYFSHKDVVTNVPRRTRIFAGNENIILGFILDNFYCVQFHPEITPNVAVKMAERDKDDVNNILQGVQSDYNLSQKIIFNFVAFAQEK